MAPARRIDLRSDTVTQPTAAMRRAMAEAEVGDDVYGEDPGAQALEAETAALLGKEAALFVPSGTMANQLALLLHCRRGDEVVVGEGAHCKEYESGGGAAWAGVQFAEAGRGGTFGVAELDAAVRPVADWLPRTSLVALENTHNRGGGRIFPQGQVETLAARARVLKLALHLDGARLWNASAATGLAPAVLAAPFDTVSVCFSKGLGAPVGSALVGGRELVARARRLRKMMGGGMRQVGVLCAAARFALAHHRARLVEDHVAARRFAEALAGAPGLEVSPESVETNIVLVDTRRPAAEIVQAAAAEGVLVSAFGPHRIRAVTHLDVALVDMGVAAAALRRAAC
jgi:threonine aldolase